MLILFWGNPLGAINAHTRLPSKCTEAALPQLSNIGEPGQSLGESTDWDMGDAHRVRKSRRGLQGISDIFVPVTLNDAELTALSNNVSYKMTTCIV